MMRLSAIPLIFLTPILFVTKAMLPFPVTALLIDPTENSDSKFPISIKFLFTTLASVLLDLSIALLPLSITLLSILLRFGTDIFTLKSLSSIMLSNSLESMMYSLAKSSWTKLDILCNSIECFVIESKSSSTT